MKTSLPSFILLLLFLSACNTESLVIPYNDKPVVESYLYVGKPITVKVSRLAAYESDAILSGDDLTNLSVTISKEGKMYPAMYNATDSLYHGPQDLLVEEGVDYTLDFSFNNKEVTATAQALSKPKDFKQSEATLYITSFNGTFSGGTPVIPDPLKLTWLNPENDYYMVIIENLEAEPQPINTSVNNVARRVFRNQPAQTSETEIGPRSFQYYGHHRLILFHVDADYASLYKDSGTSSQNITTPPTNVNNGLGIFTAINSDTLFLDIIKK